MLRICIVESLCTVIDDTKTRIMHPEVLPLSHVLQLAAMNTGSLAQSICA